MKPFYHFIFVFIFLAVASCGVKSSRKEPVVQVPVTPPGKPHTIFIDTLLVKNKAAVFYYPDSLQLEKIKAVSGNGVFEASMHEFDSQLRVSHKALKEQWPGVQVIEATSSRYLRFVSPGKDILVDLDTKGDVYGLIVFTPGKDPQQIDMMNADSQLYYYFSK